MNMRFGLKLWSTNHDLLNRAKEVIENNTFQYIELMYIPNTEITHFLGIIVPYVIHIPTSLRGMNIADKDKKKTNLKIIEKCIEWADKLNAKYLILHPGFGNISDAKLFLEEIDDKRILLENMPKVGINDEKMVGYSPNQIKELIGKKFGLCLDLNHAIKASVSLKVDYKLLIKNF